MEEFIEQHLLLPGQREDMTELSLETVGAGHVGNLVKNGMEKEIYIGQMQNNIPIKNVTFLE